MLQELFRLENKQIELENEAKQKGIESSPFSIQDKNKLHLKAKEMARNYAWLIFQNKSSANQQKDQNFYEVKIQNE